jgi:integrase
MATIENRSRFIVTVRHRADLTQQFPHTQAEQARTYLTALRTQGYKPVLTQGEDQLWVRIRQKGHKPFAAPAASYDEAEQIIKRIESDRAVGLFVDYREGHRVTAAQLMQEYLEQEVPKHKGADVEKCTIRGWIEDSTGELARRLDDYQRARDRGQSPPAIRARREPRRMLQWLQKPFAKIIPKEIEAYGINRIVDGYAPATVDRELDLFSQVCNWAINVRRLHVVKSPMDGVRRPKYFNERDRRLSEDEKAGLLAAAREEDRLRSLDLAIDARVEAARDVAATLPNRTARNRYLMRARERVTETIGDDFMHIPLYESLILFLLVTAARRGEALKLEWKHLNLPGQTAFFKDTKNGRDRSVPVRREAIPLLSALPRSAARVFPITVDEIKGAWERICKRAEIADFNLHDLRHTGISEIVEAAFLAGTPLTLPALQAITGHRDLASLARYTHVCAGHLAQVLDRCFQESRLRERLHKGRTRAWSPTGTPGAAVRDLVAELERPAYNKIPA